MDSKRDDCSETDNLSDLENSSANKNHKRAKSDNIIYTESEKVC